MKKFIICFSLILVVMFSACSCNEKAKLYFDAALDNNAPVTKTYTVTIGDYVSDGTYEYTAEKKDVYGNISVKDGVATITVEKVEAVPDNADKVFAYSLKNDFLYKVSTTVSFSVKYEKVSDEYNEDTIETTSYFFGKNLMPLYTISESTTSYLGLSGDKLTVTRLHNIDETVYHSTKYNIKRTVNKVGENPSTESLEYEYEQNTVIDNGVLLLALENYSVDKDSSKALTVITPSYGEEKGITVKCYSEQNTVKVKKDYPNVKLNAFYLTPENSGCFGGDTGKAQIVYLSKGNNGKYKMIKYVSPLTSYDSSYTSLGALIFEINEAE